MDDATREFRGRLSEALRGTASKTFQFSDFVQQSGVAREIADQAAMSLFGQLCLSAAEDGVITQPEQKRILNAANVLEISQEQAVAVVRQAKQTVYRQQLKAAQADGEVTADEEAALEQLRVSLGLIADPSAPPPAPDPDSESPPVTPGTASTFSLSEEEFSQSLQYRACSSPARILADVEFLEQFDALQAGRSASWKKMSIFGLLGALAGVILVVVGISVAPVLSAVGVVGVVVGLGFAIFGGIQTSSSGKLDLEDRRYGLLGGVAKLLSADMSDTSSFTVNLDFRNHTHADKLQRKGKVGRWNVEFYVDRWLELQGRFVDGTKFSVAMVEKHQKRHRKKRSRSGKIKHKSKTKHATEAIVSLKIKGKRYPQVTGQAKRIKQYIQLPPSTALKSVSVEGDQLTMRSTCANPWAVKTAQQKSSPAVTRNARGSIVPQVDAVNWLAMMLLSLYALLNDSK